MPSITARQRVLAYLAKQRVASAAQIGRGLNMSAAAVRHHLSVMTADGRISPVGVQSASGRGRPVKEYRLSEKTLGDNLALLAEALLEESSDKNSPKRRGDLMAIMGRRLADKMGRVDINSPAAKRLALLLDELNAAHYQARWEAGKEGPRILFAHCPYAAIILQHPELCRMDAVMLEEELGAQADQASKISQTPGGANYCIFVMR